MKKQFWIISVLMLAVLAVPTAPLYAQGEGSAVAPEPTVTSEQLKLETRFLKLERELLDRESSKVEWWFFGIAVLVGTFTLVVVGFGIILPIMLARQEKESKEEMDKTLKEAESVLGEIKHHRSTAEKHLKKISKLVIGKDSGADIVHLRDTASVNDSVSIEESSEKTTQPIKDAEPITASDYYSSAISKSTLGQPYEEIVDYNEAIRLDPNFAEAYYNRGSTKDGLGQYKEAIQDFDDAIRLKPDYAQAYNNRGISKVISGDFDGAQKDLEKSRDLFRSQGDEKLTQRVEQALDMLGIISKLTDDK